ncbi:serine/threonine-protein kinase [Catellatospora methionotrophica]|uniref:serine/threonine-protein kinase n=1 Tax=Catellatospora methionotrophica TaxID=121620 RepID=UPI00140DA90C|nr:serine/threonine-protein kinase [Catellatospora methionotrophica]
MEVPIGTALAGRYVLTRPLARGGVSTVYQAVDATAGRRLAVKVVDDRYSGLIRHEAAMTDRLRHPHVPKVLDVGVETGPDGRDIGYLALELLKGEALTSVLLDGPLPWTGAVRIAATAADVLAVAHRRGVVHRDLTPGNVMITTTGPKVVDFGLAELIVSTGMPQFANPSDDVYALGALLYQSLTGKSPYAGAHRSPHGPTALRHLAPTPVLAVRGLPQAVSDLCRACMDKNSTARPSAREASLRLWTIVGNAMH